MVPCPIPAAPALEAGAAWHTLAFLSDVHLQPSDALTHRAWTQALHQLQADALFILGDLFEVWVGDDVLDDPEHGPFWRTCADTLAALARRMPVYFVAGNRDFLVGPDLRARTGVQALNDPTLLHWQGQRWLLTHGDLLCTDDHSYQAFRQTVRQADWQQAFLARPLAERLALARGMRDASEQRKADGSTPWVDVNTTAVAQWMDHHGAQVLIHGHTHLPAAHTVSGGRQRHVLSDWDATAQPPRVQWLQAEGTGPGGPFTLSTKSAFSA
jgi:UDP-2,3-diacylglucosamine hydrolase